ncbi:MAG: sugar nucleotide-binding protein [Legionellaceae bacterium]|nr:sugar nucleotide-binding protein [Legionellaceae bacterium]
MTFYLTQNQNILIIGIDSQIGSALKAELEHFGYSVFGTTRKKENISKRIFYLDLALVGEFCCDIPMDAVFLCASITKFSDCKNSLEYSRIVNYEAQINLANFFFRQNAFIIFLSSQTVFDGNKPAYRVEDNVCPTTAHGEHKAATESKLLSMSNNVAIVRLTKVLTPDYPLILQWIQALKNNSRIEPFYDLRFSPISIKTVTSCLKEIVARNIKQTIHLSGEHDITYHTMALCLVRLLGVSESLVHPKSALQAGVASPLCSYSSLDMSESSKLFQLPDMSLESIVEDLYGDYL